MIDDLIRPLDGISTELSFQELEAWRTRQDMQYRARPAGLVRGPIGSGRLNLPDDYALFRDLTRLPKKFTVTSPYMLAKVLADEYYRDRQALVTALADVPFYAHQFRTACVTPWARVVERLCPLCRM